MAQLKDLIVNGPSRFIGDVYATTFTGDLNGNASTATSATTATALTGKTLVTASAVTTSNWSTYADNHIPTMSFMAYWNGAYSGTSSNLTYCAQGTIIGSNNIGNQSVKYATTSGSCNGNAATATKATQDGNGNVITSTYLPLSGGTMSNTNKVTNLNADLLDGYHVSSYNNKPYGTIPLLNSGGYMDVGRHFEFHYDNTTGSDYSTILACTGNYSNTVNLPSASGTLALTADNVASSSKWANARIITLTGSVTGSVSIDGSSNVTLNTTTNHTHSYLPLSGGTITGVLEVPDINSIRYNMSHNVTYSAGYSNAVSYSPLAKYIWHDILCFGANGWPTYYTSADGSTWSATELNKSLFIQKDSNSVTVLNSSIKGCRWVWNSGNFHACQMAYLLIGTAYVSSSCTFSLDVEKSVDGSTWTSMHSSTDNRWNAEPFIAYLTNGLLNTPYFRITMIRTSTSGNLALASIKGLSPRLGNQGLGKEVEFPYTWDSDNNINITGSFTASSFKKTGGTASQFLKADGSVDSNTYSKSGHIHTKSEITDFPSSLPANGGNADRAKFLETFQQNSTTNTYGSQYPIWAQWSDSTNVRLQCTNYTVWTDKATYATTAGSAPASDVKAWAKADNKPSYTGTEVTLTTDYTPSPYKSIDKGDSIQAAIAKLEGAISGLEDLLASI